MIEPEIFKHGEENGDSMIIHYQTQMGTDIFGLGVPNVYSGTDWDLGPTWCYLILSEPTTLIDTGRHGNAERLEKLVSLVGLTLAEIERIIITHSHEDHDANLADILSRTSSQLWAHTNYEKMIAYSSAVGGVVNNPEFPVSCWHCPMPSEFNQNCLSFQTQRSQLQVDVSIGDGESHQTQNWIFFHTPGHSPDSLCILLEKEILFSGDHVLPDITPHPSLAAYFENCRQVLPVDYADQNSVFGLINYIKSLQKIKSLPPAWIRATFPAHRLFYNGKFNVIHDLRQRADDIIQFHIQRCNDILNILNAGICNVSEISVEYFEPSLLKGVGGKFLAQNEILSHLEVLAECGDVTWQDFSTGIARPTGSHRYEQTLFKYLSNLQGILCFPGS